MNFLPAEASSFAPQVDSLFQALLILSSILVGAVWVLIVFFCFRYREGSKADRTPARGFRWLEAGVSLALFLFGLGIFVWSVKIYMHLKTPPENAFEINVIAKRWVWIFHDPKTGDQVNVLRVPRGRPIKLVMTSQDVIHSFFVPAFRLKQDVIPGRYTMAWFQADKVGTYPVLCTQYCGLRHSDMRATIEVVEPAELEAESASKNPASPAAEGARLYKLKGCADCHDANPPLGPRLKGVAGSFVQIRDGSRVFADENYLRESILRPNERIVKGFEPVMPTYQGQLSESELFSLIHYLKTLSEGEP